MKKSILKPIVLGVLASAVITACSPTEKDKPKGKIVCDYNISGDTVKIKFGTLYSEPVVIATKDGEKVSVERKGIVNSNKIGTYKETYTGKDCKNSQERTVEVIPSSCTYKRLGASIIEVALNGEYKQPVFEVRDFNKKLVDVEDVEVVDGSIDFTKEADYTLTYQGKVCDKTEKQTFRVKAETTECTYNIKDLSVLLNSEEIDLRKDITVFDSNNKEVKSIKILLDKKSIEKIKTDVAKEYKVTYQGEGCSKEEIRTVTVAAPVVEPVSCKYELEGGIEVDVIVGDQYKDPEYSLKDTSDKPIEKGKLEKEGELDTNKIGEYKLTYQDSNCKDSIIRTVNVVAKECIYSFANDKNSLKLKFGTSYDVNANKPTVENADGGKIDASDVTVNVEKSNTIDPAKVDSYKVVYEAKGCPNDGLLTVEILPLSCAYTLLKPGLSNVFKGSAYSDPGVTVVPAVKVEVTPKEIDTSSAGSKEITYKGVGCDKPIKRTVTVTDLTENNLKKIILPNF